MQNLIIATIVGSGLMSGLLFAFSIVVMASLLQLPASQGMFAMQRINVLIINPPFLVVFLGTAVLALIVGYSALRNFSEPRAIWLLCGSLAYLLGPVGVTLAFNVPLNNHLASVASGQAETEWPAYVSAWLRWNHVRTVVGVLGTTLLCVGLGKQA